MALLQNAYKHQANTLKTCMHMRIFPDLLLVVPASFKLALVCCSCLHHLLPWVASCSLVMHHTWLSIMPCSCVVCLLCCVLLFDSSCFVAIVRIRSSSWLHLLHGFVLLPSGISGKMTVTLDLITIIAMLVASFYRYAALPITCWSRLPNFHLRPFCDQKQKVKSWQS